MSTTPPRVPTGAPTDESAARGWGLRTRLLGATKPPSKKVTVVLDPYVTAQLLGAERRREAQDSGVQLIWLAAMISVGVTQPGVMGMFRSTHQLTTSGSKPGETMNFAPHSSAFLHWSSVTTVPAPTSISGQPSLTALIESAAAAVRNVISITFTPPASSALAVGMESFASSSTTTGTTPVCWNRFKLSFIFISISSQSTLPVSR